MVRSIWGALGSGRSLASGQSRGLSRDDPATVGNVRQRPVFSAVRALGAVLPMRRGQGGCAPFTTRRTATSTENHGPGVSGAKRREADLELPLVEGPIRPFVGSHLCFLGGLCWEGSAWQPTLASQSQRLSAEPPSQDEDLGTSGLPVTLENSSDVQVVITQSGRLQMLSASHGLEDAGSPDWPCTWPHRRQVVCEAE